MSLTPELERVPRYRKILRENVSPDLLQPDNLHLWWFPVHAIIIAAAFYLLTAQFSWWTAPILSLVIGHSFACWGFVAHEVCHGGAVHNKKVRHFLTGLCFSPFAIGATLWSRWHNAEHHGNTNHKELDPDRLFMLDEYKHNPVLKFLYKRGPLFRNLVIFGFFSMMMTQHNVTCLFQYSKDPKTTTTERFTMWWQFLLPNILWIGGTLLLGWQVFLFGFIFPLLVANTIVISYIATNHFLNPLADESDVLASSLSVTLPKGFGWLDAVHNHFGAHVAHHLYPHAPSRNNRALEREIARLWPDRYHVMPFHKALQLLWQTPWVYENDGVRLIHPESGETSPTLGNGLELENAKTEILDERAPTISHLREENGKRVLSEHP